MSVADLLAIALGGCITAYAVCGGIDFGAGVLELAAGASEPTVGAGDLELTAVREASHVWLILAGAILFSAFPAAFTAAGTELAAPLTIALLAMLMRGAALRARRGAETGAPTRRRLTLVVGAASVIAPFVLGAAAGGVAQISTAGVAAAAQRPHTSVPWLNGFSITTGVLAVALCTHLSATFVVARLARAGEMELADRCAARAVITGTILLGISLIALVAAQLQAPVLAARLEGPGALIVVTGIVLATVSPAALAGGRYAHARTVTILTAVTLIWGWLASQAPHLIGQRLTIEGAAAPPAALWSVAIMVAAVAVILGPLPRFTTTGAAGLR